MTLTGLQQAIIDHIRANVSDLSQCEAYGGQFEPDGGRQAAIHAPAVFVDILECLPISDPGSGEMDVRVTLACYCIARYANARDKREAACLDLAQNVALALHLQNYGVPGVGVADVGRMRTMSSLRASQGFAVWHVPLTQDVRIGTATMDNTAMPAQVYISRLPLTGPAHIADYQPL